MSDDVRPPAPSSIHRLHAEIDEAAGQLAIRHGTRLRCVRGCSSCCVDEIGVFEVEADRIRGEYAELLESGIPHPAGACAFLDDDGACRIYAARPYVCRTQGLPLRWTERRDEGVVEWRDICPLNEPGPMPIEALPAEDCWSIGPTEGRLAALERDRDRAAQPRRVSLRSLFGRG